MLPSEYSPYPEVFMKVSEALTASLRHSSQPSRPWYFRNVPSNRKIRDFRASAVHLVTL